MGEGVGGVLLSGEVPSAGSPDEGSWQILQGLGVRPRGAHVRLGEDHDGDEISFIWECNV